MVETVERKWQMMFLSILFVLFTAWWVVIYPVRGEATTGNYLYAATYGLIALLGGIWGIIIAQKWGGFQSLIGRSIIYLSLGLLLQEFGQLVFTSYYFFLQVEIPYPSLADLGFFGSIPLYILGISSLAKASGLQLGLAKLGGKIQAFLLPIILLIASYVVFLRGYEFDLTTPLRIFLDFGYPLGQAIYISIALLTYILSRRLLGGIMRGKVFFIVLAFITQYVADYNFLLQNSRGTWINGGYGDQLYLLAYFLLALGILQLQSVLVKLNTNE